MAAQKKNSSKKAPAVAVSRPLCGARTRKGKTPTCGHDAGWGTTHLGEGKCRMHGGLQPGDARVKHLRYSKITHETIRQLIEHHELDPDPLNILPELHSARALYTNFLNEYDNTTRALLDWHSKRFLNPEEQEAIFGIIDELEILRKESKLTEKQVEKYKLARAAVEHLGEIPGDRPTTVLNIADAYRIVSEITKIVERIEKIRAANAISRPDLNRIMNEMGRAVATFVDPGIAQKIKESWLVIRL